MIQLNRVCVPLSLDCNLHCKYCYRTGKTIKNIPTFSEDMKGYLRSLKPSFCEAVTASGGEPLFHFDKVKELFSYVPKNVHKKIMTNCTLLTQEIIDYVNENEIELFISHDGPKTEFLRGVDVLRNEEICNLIRQVKTLTVSSVITKFNTDIWENYFDVVDKLHRFDFHYLVNPVYDVVPEMAYLVDGFNYEQWFETYLQYSLSPFCYKIPWYGGKTLKDFTPNQGRSVGFNVLPDGTICGMVYIGSKYGTIYDDYKDISDRALNSGLSDYCLKSKCQFIKSCRETMQHISEHICTCRRLSMEKRTPDYIKEVFAYVNSHLDEIVKKYYKNFEGINL